MANEKLAIKVLPANNELVDVVKASDGSVMFIPKHSQYDLDVVIQVVETTVDSNEVIVGPTVDCRRATVRPYNTPRRKLWIKDK